MQNDSELLDLIEDQCLDLRCRDVAGGEDVEWYVIEHHMSAPHEREIGSGHTPRLALHAANATLYGKPTAPEGAGGE